MRKLKMILLIGFFFGWGFSLPATALEISDKEPNHDDGIPAKDKAELKKNWFDRVAVSGAIEMAAGLSHAEFTDPTADDVEETVVDLATAEIGFDVDIARHVSGHLLFKEEDDDVVIDDAFITLDGLDLVPFFMHVGKIYLPFGQFESHMISDPLTLEIGETVQNAIHFGFVHERIGAEVAFFAPDVEETEQDSTIGGFAGKIVYTLPETGVNGLGVAAGVSFISNLGDANGLKDMIATDDGSLAEHVPGFGAFVSMAFMEKIFIELEYVGALDAFRAGELAMDGGVESKPSAWNIEMAFAPMDDLEIAIRYEKLNDMTGGIGDDALAATRYGIAGTYGLFENTTLALEFLKSEYTNNDEAMAFTVQVSIEF